MQNFKSVEELPYYLLDRVLEIQKTVTSIEKAVTSIIIARKTNGIAPNVKSIFPHSKFSGRLEDIKVYDGESKIPGERFSAVWIFNLDETLNDVQNYYSYYTGSLVSCLAYSINWEYAKYSLVTPNSSNYTEIVVGKWGEHKQNRICHRWTLDFRPTLCEMADTIEEIEKAIARLKLESMVGVFI